MTILRNTEKENESISISISEKSVKSSESLQRLSSDIQKSKGKVLSEISKDVD
jgi:hypothetical protein